MSQLGTDMGRLHSDRTWVQLEFLLSLICFKTLSYSTMIYGLFCKIWDNVHIYFSDVTFSRGSPLGVLLIQSLRNVAIKPDSGIFGLGAGRGSPFPQGIKVSR